jgi:CheY-like chemotaxis protein
MTTSPRAAPAEARASVRQDLTSRVPKWYQATGRLLVTACYTGYVHAHVTLAAAPSRERGKASMAEVLVVDDDADIRESLRFALEDAGWTVDEAPDGAGALDLLRASERALVVLLDHVMPHLDGESLLRIIAGDPDLATRHAYILVTASARIQQIEADLQRLSALSVPVLRKPFDVEALLALVDQAAARLALQS